MKKIKPMVYESHRTFELLYDGVYKKYHFYIMSLGTHPTAYVEIPKNNKIFNKDYVKLDVYIDVHGGLTYSENYLHTSINTLLTNSWFIGWDYAHVGDYYGIYLDNEYTKKWTTEEIIKDCKKVIDQVKKYENKEKK